MVAWSAGQVFAGRFELVRLLGEGGMGSVWAAHDRGTGDDVALKLVKTESADLRRRFIREARAAAAVTHPNVIRIRDVVAPSDGEPALVMDLLEGESLRARLDRVRALDITATTEVGGAIVSALVAVHAAGIVHRDLKPENVFLVKENDADRVVVLDFGVAKVIAPPTGSGRTDFQTSTGVVLGTPFYMSPEQAFGEKVDARTDIWSLGVLLFECASGVLPTKTENIGQLLRLLLSGPIPSLASAAPDVPRPLVDLVDQMLVRDRADRLDDLHAISSALSAIRAGGVPRSAKARRRPSLRRTGVITLGALVAVSGVVAAIGVSLGAGNSSSAPTSVSASAPSGSSSSAPATIRIPDLPPPTSTSQVALDAYATARSLQRDGRWGDADAALLSAIKADPALAEAHFQRALALGTLTSFVSEEARKEYKFAADGLPRMGERDAAVARALEPLFAREPADLHAAVEQLRVLSRARDGDAELHSLVAQLSVVLSVPASDDARRAIEIDPDYADAWQWLGASEARLGHFPEALAAANSCREHAPSNADCLGASLGLLDFLGRCDEVEAGGPRASFAFSSWPWVLVRLQRSEETILEAFRGVWSSFPPDLVPVFEAQTRSMIAFANGDFRTALRFSADLSTLVRDRPEEGLHALAAIVHAHIAREMGERAVADPDAAAMLGSRGRWTPPPWFAGDQSLDLSGARLAIGKMAQADYDAERSRIEKRWAAFGTTSPTMFWSYTTFPEVFWSLPDDPKHAVEAARRATSSSPSVPSRTEFLQGPQWQFVPGLVLFEAGRVDDALPFLEGASSACTAFQWPGWTMAAHHLLGLARERANDIPGACRAYATVIKRWGTAKPRSVTADAVRTRWDALHCQNAK